MANGQHPRLDPAPAPSGPLAPEGPSTAASKTPPPPPQEKRSSRAFRAAAERKKYRRHGKPPYSYLALIALAIQGCPEKRLTLAQIIREIDRLFSFEDRYEGWKESIRHNLSANACFYQELRDPTNPRSKGNFWRVDVDLIPPSALKLQNTSISRQESRGLAPDLAPFILEGQPYVPPWHRMATQVTQPLARAEGGAERSQTQPRPFTVQFLLQGSAEANPEGESKDDAPLSLTGGSARVPTMASPSAFTDWPCPGLPSAFSPLPPSAPPLPPNPLGCQLPVMAFWSPLPQGPVQGALACPVMAVPFLTACPLAPPGSPSASLALYPTCCSTLPAPPFPLLNPMGFLAPRESPWPLGVLTSTSLPPGFSCPAMPPGHPS